MTKEDVRASFPGLLSQWRGLPENLGVDEQQLHFSRFFAWLESNYPQATTFRSTMGARADIEQWFDQATHQTWRN